MYCPSCGTPINGSGRFCSSCRNRLPEHCEICDNFLLPKAMFCMHCGTALSTSNSLSNVTDETTESATSPTAQPVNALGRSPTGSISFISKPEKLYQLNYKGAIASIAVSPNGLTLATGDIGNLSLWRISDGHLQQEFEYYMGVNQLLFSPDSRTLAILSADLILIRPPDDRPVGTCEPAEGAYLDRMDYSPDGKFIALSTFTRDILIWSTSDSRLLDNLQKTQELSIIKTLKYSPDGQSLAVGHDEGVHLWDLKDGRLRYALTDTYTGSIVTYSPDSALIAVGNVLGFIEVMRVSDGQVVSKIQPHSSWITDLVWNSDGETLISASNDQTVKVTSVSNGMVIHTIQGHAGRIQSLSCSKDRNTLAILNEDGTVQVWRL